MCIQLPGEGLPGMARLAAVGALRGCDPDRVVLKKAVLSGFPMRVHKKKSVIRFMFYEPDDVRWFRVRGAVHCCCSVFRSVKRIPAGDRHVWPGTVCKVATTQNMRNSKRHTALSCCSEHRTFAS